MDCAAVKPKMEALVRGTLPDAERVLAEQHIGTCEGCRLELELVRAIGSQEKPAAVGQADWTLDRIFGAEHQEGVRPQAAPASGSESAPPHQEDSGPTAAIFGENQSAAEAMDQDERPGADAAPDAASGAQSDADDDPSSQGPSSWAFEPADAKAHPKPPEESLFFAEEALARRRGARGKKGSNLRVILWGAGGVIGAILLALSSWFVLHMAPSDADVPPTPSGTIEEPGTVAPDQTSAEQIPDQPVVPEPAPPEPTQEVPEPGAPDPGTVSSDRSAGAAAPHAHEQKTSASSAPLSLPLPRSGIAASRAPAPVATKHAPPPPPRQAADAQQPGPATPRVAEPSRPSAPPSSSASDAPIRREESNAGFAEDSPPEPDAAAESLGRASEDEGAVVRPAPATSWLAPGSQRPGSNDSASPRSSTAPPPDKAPEQSEPAPKIVRPIDRIHLATVAAEEEGDLVALRRLRATWKDFMSKMGVGPDRARARREYADCLWAIQSITGRRSDQKVALAAYREYLLSAPAGGADSRSVSRLRQLEDALTERR